VFRNQKLVPSRVLTMIEAVTNTAMMMTTFHRFFALGLNSLLTMIMRAYANSKAWMMNACHV